MMGKMDLVLWKLLKDSLHWEIKMEMPHLTRLENMEREDTRLSLVWGESLILFLILKERNT